MRRMATSLALGYKGAKQLHCSELIKAFQNAADREARCEKGTSHLSRL